MADASCEDLLYCLGKGDVLMNFRKFNLKNSMRAIGYFLLIAVESRMAVAML